MPSSSPPSTNNVRRLGTTAGCLALSEVIVVHIVQDCHGRKLGRMVPAGGLRGGVRPHTESGLRGRLLEARNSCLALVLRCELGSLLSAPEGRAVGDVEGERLDEEVAHAGPVGGHRLGGVCEAGDEAVNLLSSEVGEGGRERRRDSAADVLRVGGASRLGLRRLVPNGARDEGCVGEDVEEAAQELHVHDKLGLVHAIRQDEEEVVHHGDGKGAEECGGVLSGRAGQGAKEVAQGEAGALGDEGVVVLDAPQQSVKVQLLVRRGHRKEGGRAVAREGLCEAVEGDAHVRVVVVVGRDELHRGPQEARDDGGEHGRAVGLEGEGGSAEHVEHLGEAGKWRLPGEALHHAHVGSARRLYEVGHEVLHEDGLVAVVAHEGAEEAKDGPAHALDSRAVGHGHRHGAHGGGPCRYEAGVGAVEAEDSEKDRCGVARKAAANGASNSLVVGEDARQVASGVGGAEGIEGGGGAGNMGVEGLAGEAEQSVSKALLR
mmetsp:Transcript_10430/g.40571  ORF Transcript_10430/g.40571 Transcript_10430/m.40571 type:complete len:490 (+) Transcript_10430:117-1586(+)